MAWVMSSRKDGPDIRFFIGAVPICTISMYKAKTWRASLITNGESYDCASVSDAMRQMHQLLNSPPPEGNSVGANKFTKL